MTPRGPEKRASRDAETVGTRAVDRVAPRAAESAAPRAASTAAPREVDDALLPTRPSPLVDAVLRLIWEERTISRAEIARRMDLSRSTVSELVAFLIGAELVSEAGIGESRGGRRPINLEFQDNACGIIGVDMGAKHVTVVLTNLRGQVMASSYREWPVRSDPEGTRALMIELITHCLARWTGKPDRVLGIGVAVPTPVDPRHPERFSTLVLPEWGGRNGLDVLQARFHVPVLIDNDANLGALAEQWWGAGRGFADFAYIKVATGVGSGHVIDGKVRRGATGVAGEIGHVAIDPRGALCACGNRGCLVTFVGAGALVERARTLLVEFPETVLRNETLTIEAIEAAAIDDDPLAVQLVCEAAEYLGIAIAGLLNIMNPAAVIIGGGLSQVGNRLLGPLREVVLRRTFVSSVAASEIRHSELGPLGVAVGAATFVLEAALNDPALFPTIGAR